MVSGARYRRWVPRRATRTRAQLLGDGAEDDAAAVLAGAGWTLLVRQLRVGRDEIDVLAIDPGPPPMLVAVEVRWRASRAFGLPEETFDRAKRHRLRRALATLRAADRLPDGRPVPRLPARLDLVVLEPGAVSGARRRLRHHRAVG